MLCFPFLSTALPVFTDTVGARSVVFNNDWNDLMDSSNEIPVQENEVKAGLLYDIEIGRAHV